MFFANFLTTSTGATGNTIADADRGVAHQLEEANVHPDGTSDMWFVGDATGTATAKMIEFISDYPPPNVNQLRPVAGDIDARCLFQLLNSALDIDS